MIPSPCANRRRSRYPNIKKFIVQDLPETREAAKSFIAAKGLSGRVEFEAQDFFKPQQRKGKYLFVMQRGSSLFAVEEFVDIPPFIVLHDWSTVDGAKMIKHIRDVLNEDVCQSLRTSFTWH